MARPAQLRLLARCMYACSRLPHALGPIAGRNQRWMPPHGGEALRRAYSSLPPYQTLAMPALSPTMTQGNIAKWYVKEGDEVAPGTVLADIETDKATLAFENQDDGFVARILVPDGAKDVPVGQTVAILVEEASSVAAFANYTGDAAAGGAGASSAPEPAAPAPAAASPSGDFPPFTPLKMPALSPTMEQGNIVAWHVQEGVELKPGDVLADIETDKATLAFENQDEGFLAKILFPAGSKDVAVGTMVAVVVDEAEMIPAFATFTAGAGASATVVAPVAPPAPTAAAAASAAPAAQPAVVADSRLGPAARFALAAAGLSVSDVTPTGPHNMVTKSDVLAAVAAGVKPGARPAPAAGQPALEGSKSTQADKPSAAAKPAAAAPAPPPAPAAPGSGHTDVPVTQIRKIIAARLLDSKHTTPSVYVTAEADLDSIMELRKTLAEGGTKVSVNDFVVRAAALALRAVPGANAAWSASSGDAAPQDSVDVAIAVATDTGLLTPIVRGADAKSLLAISAEVRDLAGRARANKLKPEEFQGGSFTISNLGMFGLAQFAAIINPPQGAIMAVGGAQQRVFLDSEGHPSHKAVMSVTLSADNRVMDGESAAQFLEAFCGFMHNPVTMGGGEGEQSDLEALKDQFFTSPSKAGQEGEPSQRSIIDDVNPIQLGRQARQRFDELWGSLTTLTSPTKSYVFDDVLDTTMDEEFAPGSGRVTVLVAGATGQVGRIVVRKLLLRGYRVRALVRKRQGIREDAEGVPEAVEVVEGDVGEAKDCQRAVRGVDKLIYCAAARSVVSGDLLRVDERGVGNMVVALQNELKRRSSKSGEKFSQKSKLEIADFNRRYHQLRWDVDFVGVQGPDGAYERDRARANLATAEISEDNMLVFEGALLTPRAVAEAGAEINPTLPGGGHRTAGSEGLTLRVKGDGQPYGCVISTTGGRYIARFPTRPAPLVVRLPFSLFRAETEGQPPLEPADIKRIALRFEQRRPGVATSEAARGAAPPPGAVAPAQRAGQSAPAGLRRPGAAGGGAAPGPPPARGPLNGRFKLEVDWIKALPGGTEPDAVLLSCAGRATSAPGVDAEALAKVVAAKRRGEEALRVSGLGYTIIRSGPLVDEPGGYKALVFEQSDRITQSVSFADVADICLRALREPEARNKTFDVAYEYTPDEGLQMYELVASIPQGTGSNYLKPALATLQKNT